MSSILTIHDEIKPLIKHYDIKVEYTEEITRKATKIYSKSNTYVIKKLSRSDNLYFTNVFRLLDQQRFTNYVPIVKNNYQQIVTTYNGAHFYIMPWLPNEPGDERDERHHYLFKEVAHLHKRTEKEVKLNGQEAANSYHTVLKRWKETKVLYEMFVDQCEQKLYLSPFELQAVTYFIEVSRAIEFSTKKLEEWFEKMEGKEKTRIVLNHGKLSGHHFLYDESGTGYLTNFEQSKYNTPIDDFLLFMNRTAKTYPTQCDECVSWFYIYQKNFPFTEEEMLLFLSYLAYPDRICRVIKSYVQRSQKQSELERNKQLVKAYWHFKNIEYFVMKVIEMGEKKKMEAEASEQK